MGGIVADSLESVTIQLDGTISYSGDSGLAEEECVAALERVRAREERERGKKKERKKDRERERESE